MPTGIAFPEPMGIRPKARFKIQGKVTPMPLSPNDLETPQHDSTPTLPLCDEMKVRFSETAKELEAAKVQGYLEASAILKLLDLVRDLVPLLLKR